MYEKIDGLDKKYKPLILKWLCRLFDCPDFKHSFRDQWILWSINDGYISVSFDRRCEEHLTLLSHIHPRFLGIPQSRTLKVVNSYTFYLDMKQLLYINYPEIVGHRLIKKNKEKGGTGGWHSPSDDFYTYDWEVYLSDGTSVFFHNQNSVMDMVRGDYYYNSIIRERAFISFLEQI